MQIDFDTQHTRVYINTLHMITHYTHVYMLTDFDTQHTRVYIHTLHTLLYVDRFRHTAYTSTY